MRHHSELGLENPDLTLVEQVLVTLIICSELWISLMYTLKLYTIVRQIPTVG